VDTDFFLAELGQVTELTFSQPMSSPERVAAAVVECILGGRQEIALPRLSARLATLGYLSPRLLRLLRPAMERIGARKKAAYAARKGRPSP
jgi:hypothetical protein